MALSRYLRREEICATLGIHASTFYRWLSAGAFPAGVMLGPNTRAWREDEVKQWLANLTKEEVKAA